MTQATDKRVALAQPRGYTGIVASLSERQAELSSMPKPSAVVAAQAEAILAEVDNVETILHMAASVVATQARSAAVVYAGHCIDNAIAAVKAVKAASDADKPHAMELLRLRYAAVGPWLRTTGSQLKDAVTGESRKREDSEKRALAMTKRTMSAAIRLAPRDLSADEKRAVETAEAEAQRKRDERALPPPPKNVVDADKDAPKQVAAPTTK